MANIIYFLMRCWPL